MSQKEVNIHFKNDEKSLENFKARSVFMYSTTSPQEWSYHYFKRILHLGQLDFKGISLLLNSCFSKTTPTLYIYMHSLWSHVIHDFVYPFESIYSNINELMDKNHS